MKLTVITVCYDSSATIMAAVGSVLDQVFEDLEYLVVDGGSTDGTIALIESVAAQDNRIRWVSEPDEGIADAFNKGLAMATGDWIGILNSDDFYPPGALAAVAEAVRQNPSAEVVHGNILRIDEKGQALFELKPASLEKTIWRQMPINHPATFVARSAYDKVNGFDKNLKIAMDYDLVLRLFQAGVNFMYLDRVLAHMRYGGASDERLWQGLREIWQVSVRQGYPRWKASGWFLYRGLFGVIKSMIRGFGLTGLLKLHPRFKRVTDHERFKL